MQQNKIFGTQGEQIAKEYLIEHGYEVLETNWIQGHKEIDIIAFKDSYYIFIEVKTRQGTTYGMPENSISQKKIRSVTQAALIYLRDKSYTDIRFDVISIIMKQGTVIDFLHIKDAFY